MLANARLQQLSATLHGFGGSPVTDGEKARVGGRGRYEHFGITVKDRTEVDTCIALTIASGGTLVDNGEHAPGVPYAYITDPDG